MHLRALTALLAVAVAAAPAAAQSLGEAAAREKVRRDKEGKRPALKVITEDELRGRRTAGTVSAPAADDTGSASTSSATPAATATPAPGGAAAAEPQKTEEELRAEKVAEWRQKLHDAQANVANLRAKQDEIQGALNDTRTIYGPNRAALVNQLEKAKAAMAEAEQTVANLEEEGRRNRYR